MYNVKTNTAQKIVQIITDQGQVTAKELLSNLAITPQALFRQLKKLQLNNEIYKIGSPPKVFYSIKTKASGLNENTQIPQSTRSIIDDNFLVITPSGERKEGVEGFVYWCNKVGTPIVKTAEEYLRTLDKYKTYKKRGLIDGTTKLKATFPDSPLNKLFYLDFYSIERFGKTKLGQLLLYAKQSQNPKLIRELIIYIKPFVEQLIKEWKIDCIGFIPPTVKRERQFMRELAHGMHLSLPVLPLIKIKTEVAVPQKTLSKLEDRVENARNTIILDTTAHYKNILLIDDAVGSGATLNETAVKIHDAQIRSGKIIALAITGSFKGFDVISEV